LYTGAALYDAAAQTSCFGIAALLTGIFSESDKDSFKTDPGQGIFK